MKTKIVRTLAMTVAAVSLLSVTAYAKDYNTSGNSGYKDRILDGTEGEGSATVLVGGEDRITATTEWAVPNTIYVTYKYDGTTVDKPKFVVRTSILGINKFNYYTVEKMGSYTNWKVTHTHADTAWQNRWITLEPNNSTLKTAPTAKDITYSDGAQTLVNEGTPTNGTVQYKLNNGSWSNKVPTATDVGKYTVSYYVKGNAKFNDTKANSVTVTIKKANSTYTTEPAAKSVTYTGADQELVSAGVANGGTVQYKLGDGEWSTEPPKAKEVGTYTVSYKVTGDANHNDIAEKSVTATIGEKAATATYAYVDEYAGDEYKGEASAWTVTVEAGSTAIETLDVKVNDQKTSKEGAWANTVLFGGSVTFGVAVNATSDKVTSMTAIVNGADVPATRID